MDYQPTCWMTKTYSSLLDFVTVCELENSSERAVFRMGGDTSVNSPIGYCGNYGILPRIVVVGVAGKTQTDFAG